MTPVGLICQVCVQSSDDPSLLLRPPEECRQILAPRSHLPVQGRVGQLGVQVVEVVGEEHHLAPHPARVPPELLEHAPDPGDMPHLAPEELFITAPLIFICARKAQD